jgi:hypothetical protein
VEWLDAIANLDAKAYRQLNFSCSIHDATFKSFPRIAASLWLSNGASKRDWKLTIAADIEGVSSKDPAVRTAIEALSAATEFPFDKARARAVDRPPTPEVSARSNAQNELSRMFEGLRFRARGAARADELSLATDSAIWATQTSASERPPVAFEKHVRRVLIDELDGYRAEPDRAWTFSKRVGPHAIVSISLDRLSGLGIGRMFDAFVSARFEGGPHDRVQWSARVAAWFGANGGLHMHYVTEDDLVRVLQKLAAVLRATLPELEATAGRV